MSITIDDLYNLMKNSTTEIKNEIKDLKQHLFTEIEILKNKNKDLEQKNEELSNKLEFLEKNQNKSRVVIYGIEEKQTDIYEEVVLNIINNKLKITCNNTDFRDIHRIGRKVEGKQRPIQVDVLNFRLKTEILLQAKKESSTLKNNKIYISQYYTREDYIKRKYLAEQLKIAKSKHYTAYIKNNNLIVGGETYTYEQLKKEQIVLNAILQDNLEENQITVLEASEPTAKQTSSAPQTPTPSQQTEFLYPDLPKEDKKRKLDQTPTKPTGTRPKMITRTTRTKN